MKTPVNLSVDVTFEPWSWFRWDWRLDRQKTPKLQPSASRRRSLSEPIDDDFVFGSKCLIKSKKSPILGAK